MITSPLLMSDPSELARPTLSSLVSVPSQRVPEVAGGCRDHLFAQCPEAGPYILAQPSRVGDLSLRRPVQGCRHRSVWKWVSDELIRVNRQP